MKAKPMKLIAEKACLKTLLDGNDDKIEVEMLEQMIREIDAEIEAYHNEKKGTEHL